MSLKSVVRREQAMQDVEAAVDYYIREAGGKVAISFIDALERTYAYTAQSGLTPSTFLGEDQTGFLVWRMR